MPQPLNTAVDTPNYIRIRRGTPPAYKRLRYKDPNTLYFIAEKDATTGLLYMGDKLIAGGDYSEAVSAQIKLEDLADVIQENVGDKDLLAYDSITNTWVNISLPEIIFVMSGATDELDGEAGIVPQPKAGDQDKLLTGGGQWEFIDIEHPTSGNLEHLKEKLGQIDISINNLTQQVGSLDQLNLTDRVQTLEHFMEIRNNEVTGAPVSIFVEKVGDMFESLAIAKKDITNIKLQLTWQPYD